METEVLTITPEAEHSGIEYLDIVDDNENFARLKERIAASNGAVRIFIHPFWNYLREPKGVKRPELDMFGEPIKAHKRERLAAEALGRLVDSDDEAAPPIIIFEATDSVEQSQNLIQHFSKNQKQPLFLIRTLKDDPMPSLNEDLHGRRISLQERNEAWDLLAEIFQSLEIKKIILGGQLLTMGSISKGLYREQNYPPLGHIRDSEIYRQKFNSPNQDGDYLSVSGCVADAYRRLYDRFGDIIELSNLSAPSNRVDAERFKHGKEITSF